MKALQPAEPVTPAKPMIKAFQSAKYVTPAKAGVPNADSCGFQ